MPVTDASATRFSNGPSARCAAHQELRPTTSNSAPATSATKPPSANSPTLVGIFHGCLNTRTRYDEHTAGRAAGPASVRDRPLWPYPWSLGMLLAADTLAARCPPATERTAPRERLPVPLAGCAPLSRLTAVVATTGGHGHDSLEVAIVMTTHQRSDHARPATPQVAATGHGMPAGAAIHPRFMRLGPWALSVVVAGLFGLSFATSYAALYDYALELEFSREFAVAFPLVLDAVIVVLAVTLLLERALGRRTVTIRGRQVGLRWPSWPLLALWLFFGGSVAGNVGHAPSVLAAQLVAAVPPVSAALTFHLLLRLLDRAPALRAIAETYDELGIAERERAAHRRARRDRIKTRPPMPLPATGQHSGQPSGERSKGRRSVIPVDGPARNGTSNTGRPASGTNPLVRGTRHGNGGAAHDLGQLRDRVRSVVNAGEKVTGETIAAWLGVSDRTGRRRLAALLDTDQALAYQITVTTNSAKRHDRTSDQAN